MSTDHKGDISEEESKDTIKSSTPVSGAEDSGNGQAPLVDDTGVADFWECGEVLLIHRLGVVNQSDISKSGPDKSGELPLWNFSDGCEGCVTTHRNT